MSNIKLILLFIFLTSCVAKNVDAHPIPNLPIESFVKVNVSAKIESCVSENDRSMCMSQEFQTSGSGFVIGHNKHHTFVMTAAHVCVTEVAPMAKNIVTKVETNFLLQNNKKEFFLATVYKIPKEWPDKSIDLCILMTEKLTNMPSIKLADAAPKLGETVYNIASPGGFFFPPSTPILSGHYSGNMNELHCLITVPAMGGSSGSPVLNKDGHLVGVIFAANVQLHHLSVSMCYSVVRDFVIRNSKF